MRSRACPSLKSGFALCAWSRRPLHETEATIRRIPISKRGSMADGGEQAARRSPYRLRGLSPWDAEARDYAPADVKILTMAHVPGFPATGMA